MKRQIPRRTFLSRGLMSSALAAGLLSGVSVRNVAASSSSDRVLVVLFLRGGCDGLNTLVPYRDADYYALRPTLGIQPPGVAAANSAIDLDGFFGLHPSLDGLADLYWDGDLALMPAVHFPETQHSHFVAQHIVESGSNELDSAGWLSRYLMGTANGTAAIRAVSTNDRVPQSLRGEATRCLVGCTKQRPRGR